MHPMTLADPSHLPTSSEPSTAVGTAWPPYRCPADGEPLADTGDALTCPPGHCYALEQGIPRFVPRERYAAAFGLQWERYRRTQLDSYTGTTLSRARARRCLGEAGWAALEDAQVLECGCGAGRFTEVLLGQGARVTSVDLSSAVDANQQNFPQDQRHRIAQADITALPFAPGSFDVVFCLGVVQHTPIPEVTIAALARHVRPGGLLVFDHYTYTPAWLVSTAPLFRRVLRRLPPEQGLKATEMLVRLLFPLHSRARRYRKILNRISPVQTYYHVFPELSEEAQREWALLDTHDVLTDWFKWFRTPTQIRTVLERLHLKEIEVWRGGNGVEARARAPGHSERPRRGSA
jgi:2-polyprenyl-3-methyl-5-hydroxy-6-metoxy-1,4-benzoquinol methylase